MKKWTLTIIGIMISGLVWAQFAGGTGTEGDPYQITTHTHLNNLRNYLGASYQNNHYKMMNDIDLSGYSSWDPIGDESNPFCGNFDGDGHVITNFTINSYEDYLGLFGHVSNGGTISDLGLESGSIALLYDEYDYSHRVGALIGYLNGGTVTNCYARCSITGAIYVGGLIGRSASSIISNCYATGTVRGWTEVGGLIGYTSGNDSISYNHATGDIYGDHNVGGLIGRIDAGPIVIKNYATGDIQTNRTLGDRSFGGFVGHLWNPYGVVCLEDNYATGNVTGTPEIDYVYSEAMGGFIGLNYKGSLTNCYSIGEVSGARKVGGFCGDETTGGNYAVTDCYWDTQSSGVATSISGTGKTTAEMKSASTFSSWDFDNIWSFVPGGVSYPYLNDNAQDPAPGYELTFAGGDGSSGSPWEISDPAQLNLVRDYVGNDHADKYFKLTANIDLTDYLADGGAGYAAWGSSGWLPIGTDWNTPFRGNFDGNDKTITGLSISRSGTSYIGLFGWLGSGAVISDLGLVSVSVTGNSITGSLAGVHSGSTITGCYASGTVSGAGNVGGLVGTNNATMTLCYADVTVSGPNDVGGLTGENGGTLTNSYANGNVSGTGGGSYDLGGLSGSNISGTITSCYATGSATGYEKIGGLTGINSGTITDCYALGEITGTQNLGGLVGSDNSGTMTRSYWNTATTGQSTSAGSDVAFGKTTDDMKLQPTYVSWDFTDTWTITASGGSISYPYLQNNTETPAPGLVQYFSDGSGTSISPWEITSIAELNNVRSFLGSDHTDKYFKLMNDIDLTPYLTPDADGYNDGDLWLPIGDSTEQFKGNFNGNMYKVTGLQINRASTDHVGLFSYIGSGATIVNLGVEVVESASVIGNDHVGALAGYNDGNIEESYVGGAGLITGNQSVGSLCGVNTGTVSETYTNTAVSAVLEGGGFVGKNTGTISDGFSTGAVARISGESAAFGGFCGLSDGSTIQHCYSSGSITYTEATDPDDKGFLGSASESNTFTGNYFDMTSSGQINATQAVPAAATAKTSAQMKQQTTYSGWDFSGIWDILEGQIRPFLKWEWEGVNLDGMIPVRSMEYSSGTYTGSIDMDDDEIADITVSFTPDAGAAVIELDYKYATNSNIESIQLLDNPDDLSAYYHFNFTDNSVLVNGLEFELEFPDVPENILYKQPGVAWQAVPSYSPVLGKRSASTSTNYAYTIDATALTLDEGGSGIIEFAAEKSGDVSLSVSLTDFNCLENNGSVLVSWQTASETNNAHFLIYRNNEVIASIEGAGTTSELCSYEYLDLSVIPGMTYTYVLADVDYANHENKYQDMAVTISIPETNIPTEFALEANYPNPFNPVTTISYQLPEESKIGLSIFDMNGSLVTTLVDQTMPAGCYEVRWNASEYASGIYFYRLTAGDFVETKKMMLMK